MKRKARQSKNKARNAFSDKSQTYLHIHAHALFSSLGRIVKNTFTSVMTMLVMAIAISLASGFYLLIDNMQQLTGDIESTNKISLFLKPNVSDKSGRTLAEKIRQNKAVDKVVLITKKQALKEFKEYSGFGEALNVLEVNPLPTVIQVLPKNTLDDLQAIESLMMEFKHFNQVDFAQLDMQWVRRLQTMMQIMQRGVLILTLLLGFAVLLITGNTIRLELQNRRDEVLVAKLVGATYSFIQRPFLYTGFWLGFLSGIIAWLLVSIIMLLLQSPIEELSLLNGRAFELSYFGFFDIISLLSITSFLGVLGAWIVLYYQLQEIKPK